MFAIGEIRLRNLLKVWKPRFDVSQINFFSLISLTDWLMSKTITCTQKFSFLIFFPASLHLLTSLSFVFFFFAHFFFSCPKVGELFHEFCPFFTSSSLFCFAAIFHSLSPNVFSDKHLFHLSLINQLQVIAVGDIQFRSIPRNCLGPSHLNI